MPSAQNRSRNAEEIQLERRLVLASWFASQLGYSTPERMLAALSDFNGAWEERHPVMSAHLKSDAFRNNGKVARETLLEHDRNIRDDWRRISRRGSGRLTLKYFQYLAALASEHFLFRRTADPREFMVELNRFAERAPHGALWPRYESEEDLDKLALWMATGSGKTLLMHLHYRQFLRRGPFSPAGIVLLTPNETLSAQHMADFREAGIPHFHHREAGLFGGRPNAVRVLEATKLRVGKKPGRGATEGTESFEGRFLVFADEGHKGAGGIEFMKARRALSRGGFCFEYSATFGQALYAARDAELAAEYGRAIALDYSYKHFHKAGYGKDFRVLNLANDPPPEQTDMIMLGNLLSFCQQRLLFKERGEALADYNLEPPLLLLLGTTVTGGAEEESDTDLAKLLVFLHRTAMDNGGPLTRAAGRILSGEWDIPTRGGGQAFASRLNFLREHAGSDGAAAMAKLRELVFHSPAPAALRLLSMKSASGEIGLSVGGAEPFGLAYVGNAAKLRDLTIARGKREGAEIEAMPDAVRDSLFAGINRRDSSVNILIGAKKFMEGWSSWRVSGMGLVNVGVTEGSQIIQLFGRGVRLKGRKMSLKRSHGEPGAEHPAELAPLETLNIFGSRADFLVRFAEFLRREGVAGETMEIPIKRSDSLFKNRGLLIPAFSSPEKFSETVEMSAEAKERITVSLNRAAQMHEMAGDHWEAEIAQAGERRQFEAAHVAALDFGGLRRRLTERKAEAGLFNVLIPGGEGLRKILLTRCFVIAPDFPAPKTFADARGLGDTAFELLWKFAATLHRVRRKAWETRTMKYKELDEAGGNFHPHYTVRAEDREIADEVRRLLEDCERLYQEGDLTGATALPRVYFSRHLYQPLLAKATRREAKAEILFPPELNEGERDFVESLRKHLKKTEGSDAEYFLLRNLSRGRGVGFFTDAGFYPDFILWIKSGESQRIVFIEPHGLLLDSHPDYNPKTRLHKQLTEISEKLAQTPESPEWENVRMGAFIVSQTSAEDLQQRWGEDWTDEKFRAHHILFPRADNSHIAEILKWAND